MTRGILRGKQVIKLASPGNRGRGRGRGRVCLSYQNETKCTVRVSTGFTSLIFAVRTSSFATACKKSNNDRLSLPF